MMTKRCRSNPAMTCIYGPCYFVGPCHLQDEAKREAISAGEAEYLSWFPLCPVFPYGPHSIAAHGLHNITRGVALPRGGER